MYSSLQSVIFNQIRDAHSFADTFQMHSGQGKGQFMLNVYMVGQKAGTFL